jgi:transcriptional regulator with XRE-family HTH domain
MRRPKSAHRPARPPARPEWASRLEGLRETLGLSQAALAKKLNVSAMAPSRWERGVHEPPADVFLELGKLAGKRDCWYFWERAGLTRRDVSTVFQRPAPRRRNYHDGIITVDLPANVPLSEKLVAVPLYASTLPVGHIGPSIILRDTPVQLMVVPRSWCPNADDTFCMSIASNRMAPMLRRDTIFAIDPKESDIEHLIGKIVFASHPDCGLTVSWLQRFGRSTVLVPENRDDAPFYMEGDEWKVEGRILWWFSKGP